MSVILNGIAFIYVLMPGLLSRLYTSGDLC